MKGYFICPTCGHIVGTRGRGPIQCKEGHKERVLMDFVGEGEEGKEEAETQQALGWPHSANLQEAATFLSNAMAQSYLRRPNHYHDALMEAMDRSLAIVDQLEAERQLRIRRQEEIQEEIESDAEQPSTGGWEDFSMFEFM